MNISIGVLVAGEPPEPLRERYPDYGTMVAALLSAQDPELQLRHYAVREGEFPESPAQHDAFLITGSRHGAYEDLPWILRLGDLVRELDRLRKPLIGICFGHQLIARALGGVVQKAEQGWGVGVHESLISAPAPWMAPDSDRYALVVSHQDQVISLPARAERIAGSAFCPVGMYRIEEHMFALQAHPEFSREYSRDLMEVRRELIGDARIAPGMASLARDVDAAAVAAWMLAFLHRATGAAA